MIKKKNQKSTCFTHVESTYVENDHSDLREDGHIFVMDQWAIVHLEVETRLSDSVSSRITRIFSRLS